MRREASFLKDILAACDSVIKIAASCSQQEFLRDPVRSAAVLHHLTVIGEAVARLSQDLRDRHPEVTWRQIMSVRNRIVHAYFDLDLEILWNAATIDVPTLRGHVLEILTHEFPLA
jgi:uncharacterized protein with HEPN domain